MNIKQQGVGGGGGWGGGGVGGGCALWNDTLSSEFAIQAGQSMQTPSHFTESPYKQQHSILCPVVGCTNYTEQKYRVSNVGWI